MYKDIEIRDSSGEHLWTVMHIEDVPDALGFDTHTYVTTVEVALSMVLPHRWLDEYRLMCRGSRLWHVVRKDDGQVCFEVATGNASHPHATGTWVSSEREPISNGLDAHLVKHDERGGSYVWKPGMDHIQYCDQGYQEGVRGEIPFRMSPGLSVNVMVAAFDQTVRTHSAKQHREED